MRYPPPRRGWLVIGLAALLVDCVRPALPPDAPSPVGSAHRPTPFVPPHSYEWYLRGELALEKGDAEAASDAFELALAAPDVDPYLLCRLALARARAGQADTARQLLGEAQRMDACLPELWMVRGQLELEAAAPERALGHFMTALDCSPQHGAARRAAVDTLIALGATARALALQSAGASASDRALSLPARRAVLEDALARGDVETLRRALPASAPTEGLPPSLVASVLSALGQHERAAEAWLRAAPLPAEQLPAAALAFDRIDDHAQARAAAEAALSGPPLPPRTAAVLRGVVARALRASGKDELAMRQLREPSETLASWLEEAGLTGLAGAVRTAARSGSAPRRGPNANGAAP